MSRLHVRSTCLVTELTTILCALDTQHLENTAVIFPTNRLGIACLARLAQQKKVFVPPLVTTLDGFLAKLSGDVALSVSDDLQAELILQALLTTGDFKYLKAGFSHEINELFTSLISHDLSTDFASLLQQKIAADPFLSSTASKHQKEKVMELQKLFSLFQTKLAENQQTTNALARYHLLQNIDVATVTAYFHHIYVVGFTSVIPICQTFLQALARQQNVTFYFTAVTTSAPSNPVKELIASLPVPVSSSQTAAATTANVNVISFPSPLTEVIYALHKAETLRKENCPAEIAIVLSRDHYYLPYLLTVSDLFAFEMNLAIPIPLALTPAGSFLQALSRYVLDAYQVPAAIDLVSHPLFPISGNRDQIITELSTVHVSGYGKLARRLKSENAQQALDVIAKMLQKFTHVQSFPAQLECLQELLDKLRLTVWGREQHLETKSIEDIYNFLSSIKYPNNKASPREFWQFVAEKFLTLKLRRIGEPLAGVQILSLPEIRAMPFKHIIVLGCSEGFFPKSLPKDTVLSDKMKTSIGLGGWQQLEALEDVTFNSLLQQKCHLDLCYSAAGRSRFVEKILRQPNVSEKSYSSYDLQQMLPRRKLPHIEKKAASLLDVNKFYRHFSASSSENFIRCPLRFLLTQLKITPLELRSDANYLEQGNDLHKVIEIFSKSDIYQKICHEVHDEQEKVTALTDLLNTITGDFAVLTADVTLATHLRLFAWPRLAEFVTRRTAIDQYREEFEYEFHLPPATTWFDAPYELSCKIDHFQISNEHLLILDYKRKTLPEDKEIKNAIAMQLIFYAYALNLHLEITAQKSRLSDTIVGYYSIMNGEFIPIAGGENVDPDFLSRYFPSKKQKFLGLEEQLEKMQKLLSFRYDTLKQQDFYPSLDPSFCSTCQFEGICRKEDPAYQQKISTPLAEFVERL